jgi:PleD family two-component response regulator
MNHSVQHRGIMAQTPNVIGITVMQRLKETGEPPTPENYERLYYELSGLPPPEKPQPSGAQGQAAAICAELIQNTVEASHKELQETRYALINMQNELAETRQLLNEDALTSALNRRGLDQTLAREIARCQRNDGKLSLAMVDLDYFKRINDEHGHEAGDQMLIHFTTLIRSVLRKSDALLRRADEALYKAKASGRNKIILAT